MHRPAARLVQPAQSFPAHLLPTVGLQHLESMVRVGRVLAHPVRERDVVHEQGRIVPPRRQPGCLSVSRDVKQADCSVARWRHASVGARGIATTSCSSTHSTPGSSSPATSRRAVDLPAPLAPLTSRNMQAS